MKTKLLLLVIALLTMQVQTNATIRTVSNDINHPAQFPDIGSAIAAASAGDTIYVNGTQYTYPDITINKKIVLIGAGYNSPNQFNLISAISTINFLKDAGVNDGSGTVITGFKILSSVASGTNLTISNVKLFRNWIGSADCYPTGFVNWAFYDNLITGSVNGRGVSSNVIFQNNIFAGGYITSFNQPSVVIDHNLFINTTGLTSLQFSIITNNIFTSSSGTACWSNVTQSTFNNNLSVSTTISSNAPTNSFLANNNTGGGNQVGVNPLYTAYASFNSYTGTDNYRLQATSTGHNAGTDGTDLGIYGGSYPFPSGGVAGGGYDTSPLPPIPQINSVNIQNASVLPGAQLQVNVSATVNN